MADKPTYEELERRLKKLENENVELKKAEEALRESEERFRTIFETAQDSIFIKDRNLRYILINPTMERLFGVPASKLVGRTDEDLFGKEAGKHIGEDDSRVLAGEIITREDTKPVMGIPTTFHVIKVPVHDSSGEISGLCGIARNITERKRTEEALRDSEKRYRALADAAFEAIFISEKGICTDANRAATKMFGYEYDELIGIFGTDVIAPESKKLVKHYMLSGYEEPYEAIAQGKDGTTFHTEIRGKMTQYKGRNVRITVVHDIDDRKRTEEILRKAHEELEMKVEERTAELVTANDMLEQEIEERKQIELALIERRKELESKTHELEEVNAALKVLLKHRNEDKNDFEEKVVANVKKLVLPYVEKLNNGRLNGRQIVYLDIIKSNLEDIITPFLHKLSSKYSDLTPSEIQVAGFVKDGKTTKEIAESLNSSTGAIDFHRNNLRKKLGLRNTKTNLRSFLLSFT